MKATRSEVRRQIDNNTLDKYQKLQKFWNAHVQSNLIVFFLGATAFTDEQKSSSS